MGNCTIAAIATPMGSGGIGIIRISGRDAVPIAASVFRKSGRSTEKSGFSHDSRYQEFQSRHFYHGHIIDPENEREIDEVLLVAMKAPFSYTREDVVEIHAHGGFLGLNAILGLVLKMGARLAQPGEFTKRAFLNGRIDLTQAEAVIDCINARTRQAFDMAIVQMKGGLRKEVESIKMAMVNVLTQMEAVMDFPDAVQETIEVATLIKNLREYAIDPLKTMIRQHADFHILKDGIRVAAAGRANVGKSSLMNCLAQRERAIVTAIPGTTRDVIEENLNIGGIPIVFGDTAGLNKTDNPIELLGIKKTHEYLNRCDLILFMIDSSQPLTQEDYEIYEEIKKKKVILVWNKKDLVNNEFHMRIPDSWNEIRQIRISALFEEGIEALKDLIKEVFLAGREADSENWIVPNLRHKSLLEHGLKAILDAEKGIQEKMPFELIAIDLNEAIALLNEILGVCVKDDIIGNIFDRFCIGK